MKKIYFIFVCLLITYVLPAFCETELYINKSSLVVEQNKNENSNSWVLEKNNVLCKYIFIGKNKIECYAKNGVNQADEKECTLELKKIDNNNCVLNFFNSSDSLINEYFISFFDENRIRINNDSFVLQGDSYYQLKRDILIDMNIKDFLEFLKMTLFIYEDFYQFEYLGFITSKIKYYILSASIHFSTGQSDWIYTYEAKYNYNEGFLKSIEITDEEDIYYKLVLKEKNEDFFIYNLFHRIAEGCTESSIIFIDLKKKIIQESGELIKSTYEYLYQNSWILL